MRVSKPWVQPLHITEDQYQAWAASVPKHESVTFWCLEKGMIRSADYFAWACEYYGLPLIEDGYFGLAPNRKLWSRIQSVANWTPEMLPLEEWDGVVFVGCVEPPTDIQWSFPVHYVLATARDLKYHWQRLNTEATKQSTPFIPLQRTNTASGVRPMPTAPTSQPTRTPASAPAPAAANSAPAIILAPPPATPAPAPAQKPSPASPAIHLPPLDLASPAGKVAVDSPEGLNLNLNFASPQAASPTPVTPPLPNIPSDMPEGLSLGDYMAAKSDAPAGLTIPANHDIFYQDDIPTGVVPLPDLNQPQDDEDLTPVHGVATKPPEPAQPVQPHKPVAPQAPPPPVEGAIDSDRLATASIDQARTNDEAIAWAFQQLKQHFTYSWILYVQDATCKVWRWEKTLRMTSPDGQAAIDLNQPSLFRIVSRTQMPYHGHVVESPINSQFFKSWGLRKPPAHVTATPLVSDGHLTAILLGATDTVPANPDQVLRFCEKLSTMLAGHFGKKLAA